MICEWAVESFHDLKLIYDSGGRHFELCSNLAEGGLTPALSDLQMATALPDCHCRVLIRPHRYGFQCSDLDKQQISFELKNFVKFSLSSFVLTVLNDDGSIDESTFSEFQKTASPQSIDFHRAVDGIADKKSIINVAKRLGIRRILSAGGLQSAWDHRDELAQMQSYAGPDLRICAAGSIVADQILSFHHMGIHEIHASAYRESLEMRNSLAASAFKNKRTYEIDWDKIQSFSQIISTMGVNRL